MRSHLLPKMLPSASRLHSTTTTISSSIYRSLISISSSQHLLLKASGSTTINNTRLFSTSPTVNTKTVKMAANSTVLLDAFKARRSIYPLNKTLTISKDKINAIVKEATVQVPSSFNSQSNRVVVLHGAEHEKLWDIATEILKKIVPADSWEPTAQKMAGFRAGAGTVLFFVDNDVVAGMQAQFAAYKDRFPVWAEHSSAMLQFALWTTLEAEGLGANLQHYNPLIDEKIVAEWGVPKTWQLSAQLVFGGRAGEAGPKDHLPLEQTVKVFGA